MKKLKEFIGNVRRKVREKLVISKVTMTGNFVMALGKIVMGLFSLSFFIILNGFYSLAVGSSKVVYVKGRKESGGEISAERKYYLIICLILTAASVFYIIYTARLFFYPNNDSYNRIIGISAAAIAFTELTVAIVGLVKSNKKKDLLMNGHKCVSLASAFTAIAFTQVALLSFDTSVDMSYYNAIGGVVFGSMCLLICFYMLIKYFLTGKKNNGYVNIADENLKETRTENNTAKSLEKD